MTKREELVKIITIFATSGWDLIAIPSKEWLDSQNDSEKLKTIVPNLVSSVEQADKECGHCGCELDQLYKKFLFLKDYLYLN